MKKIALIAVLAGLTSSPAFAQEESTLTGFSGTALLGWDQANLEGAGFDEKKDDVFYGLALGYDIPAGGVILGVEGEISDSSVSQSYDFGGGADFKIGAGRDLYAGVKVGLPVSPKAVIYAKGGYTAANVDLELNGGGLDLKDSEEMDGYRLGLGRICGCAAILDPR